MTRMVVQLQSSDTPQDSFAAKPRTIVRAGTQYGRIEEQPDPENGIHGLVIVNEPDLWMANLAENSARHIVDPGPTFNLHLPIFGGQISQLPDEELKPLTDLEFGNEMEFFRARGATPQRGPVLQTKQTTSYVLRFGESSVALFTYGNPERPLSVAWTRGEKNAIFWYSVYESLDFDSRLFEKPAKMKIEETKP